MADFQFKFETVKHENFGEFLAAMGTPKEKIAQFVDAKPTVEITLNKDILTVHNSLSGAKEYILNKEVDETFGGHKLKSTATMASNGDITIVTKDPASGKSVSSRMYTGLRSDELVLIMQGADTTLEAKLYLRKIK